MSYLEELLPEFRKGAKITKKEWDKKSYIYYKNGLIYDRNNQIMYNFSDFVHPYCVTDDYQGAFLWGYTTETYIGKSKAKLSDLFEVQDD